MLIRKGENKMENSALEWDQGVARASAPHAIIMVAFILAFSIWFGFAWGTAGWILFAVAMIGAVYILVGSLKNRQLSKSIGNDKTSEVSRIERSIGFLVGVTYATILIVVILLFVLEVAIFIVPFITLVMGIHFLLQAPIMNRRFDYYIAPLPLISSCIAAYFAFQPDASVYMVFAIAGIGGAAAALIYGFYVIDIYKKSVEAKRAAS